MPVIAGGPLRARAACDGARARSGLACGRMDTANQASPPCRSRAEHFCDLLVRYRLVLLALWLVHAFALHFLVIGFASSDGLAYRGVPAIEWAQHHSFGMDKYPAWPYAGNVPFVELAHIPFLLLFGLRGLLIGFPL